MRGVDGLLSLLTDHVDGELLDAAGPGLKVVSNYAVGYDNIDVAVCRARGVAVGNTPGVLTETTADLAFALLMAGGVPTQVVVHDGVEVVLKVDALGGCIRGQQDPDGRRLGAEALDQALLLLVIEGAVEDFDLLPHPLQPVAGAIGHVAHRDEQ